MAGLSELVPPLMVFLGMWLSRVLFTSTWSTNLAQGYVDSEYQETLSREVENAALGWQTIVDLIAALLGCVGILGSRLIDRQWNGRIVSSLCLGLFAVSYFALLRYAARIGPVSVGAYSVSWQWLTRLPRKVQSSLQDSVGLYTVRSVTDGYILVTNLVLLIILLAEYFVRNRATYFRWLD